MSFEAKILSVVKTMFKVMVNRRAKELNQRLYKTILQLQHISQNKSKINTKTCLKRFNWAKWGQVNVPSCMLFVCYLG